MIDKLPVKVATLLRKCIDDIVKNMTKTISEACDKMPDVEENKTIMINSILAGVFSEVTLMVIADLDHNQQRKYTKDLFECVYNVVSDDIVKKFIEKAKNEKQDDV